MKLPAGGTLESPNGIFFYSPAKKGDFEVGFIILKKYTELPS